LFIYINNAESSPATEPILKSDHKQCKNPRFRPVLVFEQSWTGEQLLKARELVAMARRLAAIRHDTGKVVAELDAILEMIDKALAEDEPPSA